MIGADAAFIDHALEELFETGAHKLVDGAVDLADVGVARRFQSDLDGHDAAVGIIFDEVRLTDRGKCCKEIRCARELCEARLELLPISLGKAGDQIFFGCEVEIKGAG